MTVIAAILAIMTLSGYAAAWIICTVIDDISREEAAAMCDVCRQFPCDPRCPNAPEPEAVYTCCNCREGICEGDTYYIIDNKKWCEECINECAKIA